MIYPLVRKLLFYLSAETSHDIALEFIGALHRLRLSALIAARTNKNPLRVMGLDFPNPVGLAAGMDKNGDYIDALGALGFGFIEIGTVTPKPQEGNPKKRLFRLKEDTAIINRMGFNNDGVLKIKNRLKNNRNMGRPLGIYFYRFLLILGPKLGAQKGPRSIKNGMEKTVKK